MRSASCSVAVPSVDWAAFDSWLRGRRLRDDYRRNLLNYARRYAALLFEKRLHDVERYSARRTILTALANLARFTGQHGEFTRMRAESGISWSAGIGGEDVFMAIYNGAQGISNVEDWLESVRVNVPWRIWFPTVYLALTGLRTSEGLDSLNLVARNGLDAGGYLNRQNCTLEHFRYRDTFLRKTKRAYLSVMTDKLVQHLEEWKQVTSYSTLREYVVRNGLACRFYDCRKLWATSMRLSGIEAEFVDLLEGRLGSSVFVKSYLRPDFGQVIERVRKIIEVNERRWLD
jgi:hypothetical protein